MFRAKLSRRAGVVGILGVLLLTPSLSYGQYGGRPADPHGSTGQTSPASGTPLGINKSLAGALAGAAMGAATGAIVGNQTGDQGKGAVVGAALGGLSGYILGRQIEDGDRALAEQERILAEQRREIARNRELIEELKKRRLDARETERGVVVNLPDILFAFDSARLTSEAREKVHAMTSVLERRAPRRRISIEGHADSIGTEAYNFALSQRRAEAVAQELAFNGIRGERLTVQGYGEKYPIAPNTNPEGTDSPAGRAQNRRVEVVIEN